MRNLTELEHFRIATRFHGVSTGMRPESQHINDHPRCLHLWRPLDREIPLPPSWLVGGVSLEEGRVAYEQWSIK